MECNGCNNCFVATFKSNGFEIATIALKCCFLASEQYFTKIFEPSENPTPYKFEFGIFLSICSNKSSKSDG